MNFGSVCSGIEAASVAWHPLGWKAAWLAEIEPFPCAVLAHHYPDVRNLGDMTTIIPRVLLRDVEAPDVFTGGTPCQAFSVAGKRESLADARGNLSLTFCEIANAIDDVRAADGREPCIVVWENVPGVLSTSDNAFGCFLGALAGAGCELQPAGGRWANAGLVLGPRRAVAWRIIDAQYFGLAQRRRRVFVVASARKGFDPATVLFEWDGVRRDTAPSREARQTAPTIPARSTAGGGFGTDFDCDGGLIQAYGIRTANTSSNGWGIQEEVTHTLDCAQGVAVAHTLRGEGFDASEDGTGRGTPLVPVGVTIHGTDPTVQKVASYDDLAQCLRARTPGNIDNSSTTVVQQPVAFDTTQITSAANYSNPKPGDPCHPLAAGAHPPAVAFTDMRGDNRGPGIKVTGDIANTLHCAKGQSEQQAVAWSIMPQNSGKDYKARQVEVLQPLMAGAGQYGNQGGDIIQSAMAVRRLTPRECERLQGFPDDYTLIPWRNKPASECPDGPRYKALGNSWAVPCARWIGERIQEQVG